MAVWVRVARGVDVDAWRKRAAASGVLFNSGKMYTFDGRPAPFARLEFARLDEKDVHEVVRRLNAALEACAREV